MENLKKLSGYQNLTCTMITNKTTKIIYKGVFTKNRDHDHDLYKCSINNKQIKTNIKGSAS